MSWSASYGDILKSKETGREYEVIDWLNDDGGTIYTLRDVLNDKLISMDGGVLTKTYPDNRVLLSLDDINKLKAEAIHSAITHAAKTDDHQRNSYEAYAIMTEYANKLERGEL